jgi:hypothetical protein
MTEAYLPPSDFLKSLIEDHGLLMGDNADSNIPRVIELSRDEHPGNRAQQ